MSKIGSEWLPVEVMHCSLTRRRNQVRQHKPTIWQSDGHGASGDV